MSLCGLPYEKLKERLAGDGVNPVHALPLYRAIHQELAENVCGREEFQGPLRRWLAANEGELGAELEVVGETGSGDGWTTKFLMRLGDGSEVEAVLMGFPGRFTVCVSSQVGCAMGCVFCATGHMGFRRHLSAAEIVAQAHTVEREVRKRFGRKDRVRNLVMMGMGEPLHNFDAVMEALEVLTDTRGMNIGAARMTVSTVGHVPGIRKLTRYPKKFLLSVSLHGATDEERQALIPVNRRWPLADLMDACREYSEMREQRVFIAWTLIGGVNDDVAQAGRLAALLAGMDVHVNLIPLNPTGGYDGKAPGEERVDAFQKVLRDAGLPSTVRQRRGIDVSAGCGQLATRS